MNTQIQEALKMASLFMAKESLTVEERHQLLQTCKEALANEKEQYDFDAEFDAGVLAND